MNLWNKFLSWVNSLKGLGNLCPECKTKDSLWRFESDSGEYIDECVACRYTRWWIDEEDNDSQTDYKTSLKNDY